MGSAFTVQGLPLHAGSKVHGSGLASLNWIGPVYKIKSRELSILNSPYPATPVKEKEIYRSFFKRDGTP
jgi:hypothetical protein